MYDVKNLYVVQMRLLHMQDRQDSNKLAIELFSFLVLSFIWRVAKLDHNECSSWRCANVSRHVLLSLEVLEVIAKREARRIIVLPDSGPCGYI